MKRAIAIPYMNFSARTLHRTREQLTQQYLKEGQLTLSEIALLLGYSEQGAFTRAFK